MKSGSEKLNEAYEAIVAFRDHPGVGKSIKAELGEIAASVDEIRSRLAEIEDLYAIDFGTDIDSQIQTAMQLWGAAPDGKIDGDQLQKIRSASPVMSTLYLKGIDILSAYKFSSDETDFARRVGGEIDEASEVLGGLRRARRNPKNPDEWSALIPLRQSLSRALDYLENTKAISVLKLLIKTKEGKWVPFKRNYFRDSASKEQLLLVYRKGDARRTRLLEGEWLNCYVYEIIRDQLTRHGIPFELYTDLTYRAPKDLIRAASEFDVIGRFRDTVVCVECKSGRLDAARGDFNDICQRTEAVRKVLSVMGERETDFLFFVVYDAAANPPEEMERHLGPSEIHAIQPSQVRAVMARMLDT